jgi:hypothetical protein
MRPPGPRISLGENIPLAYRGWGGGARGNPNDEIRITNDEIQMTKDEGRITNDEIQMTKDEGRITNGESCSKWVFFVPWALSFVIRHLDFVIRHLAAISSPTVLCYILYCPIGEMSDVD